MGNKNSHPINKHDMFIPILIVVCFIILIGFLLDNHVFYMGVEHTFNDIYKDMYYKEKQRNEELRDEMMGMMNDYDTYGDVNYKYLDEFIDIIEDDPSLLAFDRNVIKIIDWVEGNNIRKRNRMYEKSNEKSYEDIVKGYTFDDFKRLYDKWWNHEAFINIVVKNDKLTIAFRY